MSFRLQGAYNYLSDQILPEDENLQKFISVEKDHHDVVDGVLLHRYESRGKKKPIQERTLIQFT